MKKQICMLLSFFIMAAAFAQTVVPGLSEPQKQQLLNTKIALPLPTWVPEGYTVTHIVTKTGRQVKIENKVLTITYGKKLLNGKKEEFKIDAGFEGLGDLPYEGSTMVKSKVATIYLYYEPYEEDGDNKKIKQYGLIMTEWFYVKNLAFHVVFNPEGDNHKFNKTKSKISKADAIKILQSMQVLK